MDGTFDLQKPLYRLKKSRPQNTTKRNLQQPLSVIYTYVELLFGFLTASAIVNGTEGLNTFKVDKPIVSN